MALKREQIDAELVLKREQLDAELALKRELACWRAGEVRQPRQWRHVPRAVGRGAGLMADDEFALRKAMERAAQAQTLLEN